MAYDGEIRINTKVDTSQMQRLQIQIDKATDKVAALAAKYDELSNKKIPTKAYTDLTASLEQAKAELQKYIAEEEKLTSAGVAIGAPWDNVIAKEADAQLKVEAIQAEMQRLVESGKAFSVGGDTEGLEKASAELSRAKAELRALVTKQDELNQKTGKTSDGLKKMGEAGKKAFGGMNRHAKKSGGILSSFASRLKGIMLSLLIFNWITRAFNAMVSGMKQGFGNLAKYSDDYKQSVSGLKSANDQLKNSLAAAFAPIVQAVIPHLITLINYITAAANKVAQFVAVLTGKSTWTKATAVQEDYAASLNGTAAAAKKAAGALASFDTLEVLSKKDDTSGGGGGAAGSKPGDMFEEIPIEENTTTNFAQKLKEAIVAEDWYGVGALLGEKLNEALENIQWDEIKEKARALGKNIAEFLNSGLETVNWELVGGTLAEGLNTGIELLYAFASNFHWDSLGEAIAGSINGFFSTFDFVKAGLTLSTFAVGLLTALRTSIKKTNFYQIGKSLADFLNAIEWVDILKIVGKTIVDTLIASIDFAKGFKDNADLMAKTIVDSFLAAGIIGKIAPLLGMSLKEAFGIGFFAVVIKEALASIDKGNKKIEGHVDAVRDLMGAMPKQEDYTSVRQYNQALDEWHEELKKLEQQGPPELDFGLSEEEIEQFRQGFESAFFFNDWIDKSKILWDDIKQPFIDFWTDITTYDYSFDNVFPTASSLGDDWDNLVTTIKSKLDGIPAWIDEKGDMFQNWYETDVAPWFTTEKWQELGQSILDGISFKWAEFCVWWSTTALGAWWAENVAPWFTVEKWQELAQGIPDGISETWAELVSWWDTNICAWWDNNVAPWFTVERWRTLGEAMKKGIYNGFYGVVSKITDVINSVITACEKMVNYLVDKVNNFLVAAISTLNLLPDVHIDFTPIGHVTFDRVKVPPLPALADGAVIRGGNPFAAILGDQRAGQTNIEAPADLIKDMTRQGIEESGIISALRGSGSREAQIVLDGEVLGRLTLPHILDEWHRVGYSIEVLD